MPEVAVSLKQVLQVLDQLNPDELAAVEQRLAARQQTANQAPTVADDLFELPFDEYLALPDETRDAIAFRAYQTLGEWIDAELARRKAEWMLVCGGEIIETSPTLQNYPARERLLQLGRERGKVPFVFIRTPLIEESAWSPLPENDFYPTLTLTLAASGVDEANRPMSGLEINADFDTGSPDLFVNYEQLLANQIVDSQPIDQTHFRPHLGQSFRLHVLPILLGIKGEDGAYSARELSVHCIRNWSRSPLCLINPKREALAGRNLLLEFPLCLELDGAAKTTRITRV